MTNPDSPTVDDLLAIVANLVPDIPKPSEIMYVIEGKDSVLWLEGWCDGCIADKGFPPKGKGMLQEKLDYIRGLTPGFMEMRAKKRGLVVHWSGFLPLTGKKHLYGISWGVFRKGGS